MLPISFILLNGKFVNRGEVIRLTRLEYAASELIDKARLVWRVGAELAFKAKTRVFVIGRTALSGFTV